MSTGRPLVAGELADKLLYEPLPNLLPTQKLFLAVWWMLTQHANEAQRRNHAILEPWLLDACSCAAHCTCSACCLAREAVDEGAFADRAEAKLAELRRPCGACSGSGCFDCSPGLVQEKLRCVEAQLAAAKAGARMAIDTGMELLADKTTAEEKLRAVMPAVLELKSAVEALNNAEMALPFRRPPYLENFGAFVAAKRKFIAELNEVLGSPS